MLGKPLVCWGAGALALTAVSAGARTRYTGSCVFTIGRFCPLESIGATLAGSLALGLVVFGVRWLFHAATSKLPASKPLAETIKVDPKFAGEVQFSRSITNWREALEKLPVDQYLVVKGVNVWKVREKNGRTYFYGDAVYQTVDDVLARHNLK